MDVLVLGGTVFLGRAVVGEALARGDRVTVFNRGRSGPAPDGAEQITGDRTCAADLGEVSRRNFDLVVDTSGYVPAEVGLAARALADSCGHYGFVSSISVYPDWPAQVGYQAAGVFGASADATRDTVPSDVEIWQHYGWLKAGCELAVEQEFGPQRCAVLRAGGIVGPHDSAVGRLPWWLDRFARGGEVLVPGHPSDPIAVIDSRDLARFALGAIPGIFECGGPHGRDTWGDLVDALSGAVGGTAEPTWVDGEWLLETGVEPWTEVPLWAGTSEGRGTWAHDNSAAEAAGLRHRPLAETVTATWDWQRALPKRWLPSERTPGLAPERERALLALWHTRP